MKDQNNESYKLFSREGDIKIYGIEFIEKLDAFKNWLKEIEEDNSEILKNQEHDIYWHLRMGYTDMTIVIQENTFPVQVQLEIKSAIKTILPDWRLRD